MRHNPLSRWTGLWPFAATEARVQLHEYLSILTSIMVQAIFIFFVALLQPSFLPYAMVGAMVFSVFIIGERVLNEAAYIRIDHKLNELYHASPLTAESYFVGIGLGVLIAYLPPVVLLAAVSEFVHPFSLESLGVLVLTLTGVWFFAASLGYVLSTLFRDMRAIWPYSSLLFNVFGVLPPVFYPLYFLPSAVQPLALLMPPSAAAALVMHSFGLVALSPGEILNASVAIAGESSALFLIALVRARQFSREK